MRAQPIQPDETFAPAPAGVRVRVMTGIVILMFVILMAVQAWILPSHSGADYWVGIGAPLFGVPVVVAVWWVARIRAYRLEGRELVVVRPVFPVRHSLEGLESIEPDRDPFSGARKRRGNDGLGAVSGTFRSRKLGDFRAYVTDREQGVVLRTAAGTFVVSPAQPAIFIDAVRRRAVRRAQ
jgi:hypothetical protein